MKKIVERYLQEVHEELEPYQATWSPATHLALGDCGTVEDGLFTREANVRDFGVDFDEAASPATGRWVHKSSGAVEVTIQASGDAAKIPQIPAGKAGILLEFSREYAVVFVVPAGRETTIDNVHRLKQQLLQKAVEGPLAERFPQDFAVVTHVVTADVATVLISEERGGTYAASAEADFKAGLESLADASVEFSVASEHKVRTELKAETGATPLFRGFRLKRNGWGELTTGEVGKGLVAVEALPFEDL